MLHVATQPLDLQTQCPDLPLSLVTLAPLQNVAAKALDLDQHLFIRAAAITCRRGGRVAAIASAAIANLFLEPCDLTAQRVDCLQQLRGHIVG